MDYEPLDSPSHEGYRPNDSKWERGEVNWNQDETTTHSCSQRRTFNLLVSGSMFLGLSLLVTLTVFGLILRDIRAALELPLSNSPAHSMSLPQPSGAETPTSIPTILGSCGNDTAEATEAGCIFDIMLSTWIHPLCHHPSQLHSALSSTNFTFFLDEELTQLIPTSQIHSGYYPQHYIWTQPSFHSVHCGYMWNRQIKAWNEGGGIDSESADVMHTGHCVKTMLEPNTPYLYKSARLRVAFSDCLKM